MTSLKGVRKWRLTAKETSQQRETGVLRSGGGGGVDVTIAQGIKMMR